MKGAHVALAVGGLAVAGAGVYLITKKKGPTTTAAAASAAKQPKAAVATTPSVAGLPPDAAVAVSVGTAVLNNAPGIISALSDAFSDD